MGFVGIRISNAQADVVKAIVAAGGDPFFVGGIVRDRFMEIIFNISKPAKDMDIEVFDIDIAEIVAVMKSCDAVQHVDIVGTKFSVITVRCIDGTDMDISSPRRETKVGMGSSEFDAVADPFMSKQEAASRRDFSMGAIMVRCITGEVFDFFGGIQSIEDRTIRAVGPRFVESPDRMVRAGRFAAQFGFAVDAEVVSMCQEMAQRGEFQTIFAEKMAGEMVKICHSNAPSRAFRFFIDAGFGAFMPEVAAMIGCKQDVRHHPEGDVFEHTCRVMDEMARVCNDRGIVGDERVIMVMGAICHDMGKPASTTIHADGAVTSEGHAAAGVAIARSFMRRMGFCTPAMIQHVCQIVKHHMDGIGVKPTARIVRRWAVKFAPMTIAQFAMITQADASGRDTGCFQPCAAFEAIAVEQNCSNEVPVKIIQGRHCIAAGIKPGVAIGAIIAACFEAQIDGVFNDHAGGIAFMQSVSI